MEITSQVDYCSLISKEKIKNSVGNKSKLVYWKLLCKQFRKTINSIDPNYDLFKRLEVDSAA